LFISTSVLAQTQKLILDQEKSTDGIDRIYFPSGALMAEANYKGGKLEGSYKGYYESGPLASVQNFKNDKLDGEQLLYYPNGQLKQKVAAAENGFQGALEIFYEDGTPKLKAFYQEGKLNGTLQEFSRDGRVFYIENYQEGKMLDKAGKPFEGVYRRYYESGNLKSEMTYADGNPAGEFRGYYEDGALAYEGKDFWEEGEAWKMYYGDFSGGPSDETTSIIAHGEIGNYNAKGFLGYDKAGNIIAYGTPDEKMADALEDHRQAQEYCKAGQDLQKGRELIVQALKISPDNEHFLATQAQLLFKMAEFDEAYIVIRKAVSLRPDFKRFQEIEKTIQSARDVIKRVNAR
jgi:antitoxin component YwqK of YwqJK toxin-antitoxin module